MAFSDTPHKLIEALEEYLERHPSKKEITILSTKGLNIKFGDMPNEIRNRTKIGIDYEKSMYKMAFEDLLDGNKTLDV